MRSLVVVVAQRSGSAARVSELRYGRAYAHSRSRVWMKRSAFAIGLGRVGPGADVARAEHPASLFEQPGDVARAVVGHHASTRMPRRLNQRSARTRKPVTDWRFSSGRSAT
jgi:hypothetical protein